MADQTPKERRQAKRATRKEKRAGRKKVLDTLITTATHFKFDIDLDPPAGTPEPKFEVVFDKIWPVLGPAVKFAELHYLTGDKTDKVLNTVYTLGEQISKGDGSAETQNQFVNSMNKIWGPLRIGLTLLKTITNDKVDDVIDDIIDVCDWLTGNDDDD